MSRPSLSVPSRWVADGPWLIALESWAVALCGAIRGAKIATRIQKTTIARPMVATRDLKMIERPLQRPLTGFARRGGILPWVCLLSCASPYGMFDHVYRIRGLRKVYRMSAINCVPTAKATMTSAPASMALMSLNNAESSRYMPRPG